MAENKQYTKEELEKKLTHKQRIFCKEYVIDWNGARAARIAGYSKKTARVIATQILSKLYIQQYIAFIKNDFEMLCGISKAKNINELAKIAFSSIAHLHDNWIELSEWEQIKEENPSCMDAIESIDTKTEQRTYNEEPVEIVYIKIKLYSKTTALQELNKMMGYNEPENIQVLTNTTEIPKTIIKTNAKSKNN